MSLLSFTKKLRKDTAAPKEATKEPESSTESRETGSTSVVSEGSGSRVLATGLLPLLTEKSVTAQESGVAVFRVRSHVAKPEIAAAVRERYGVAVSGVRTIRMRPKTRRRGATFGSTTQWKKAYVTVDDVSQISSGP